MVGFRAVSRVANESTLNQRSASEGMWCRDIIGRDKAALAELGNKRRRDYVDAQPFPHIVLDDFFDDDFLEQVVAEFPPENSMIWSARNHSHSQKLASDNFYAWGKVTQRLMMFLNGPVFLDFLERLTGIEGLIPDPHYFGGGLHSISSGGFLGIHADFNWHDRLRLDRRINLLVYLNREWDETFGGNLELWTRDVKRMARSVAPMFNRVVVFNTTDFSFHGHPDPLRAPLGVARKSIALYYYTNGRPSSELSDPHSTLYRRRPGERNAGLIRPNFFHSLLPPILYDAFASLKRLISKSAT